MVLGVGKSKKNKTKRTPRTSYQTYELNFKLLPSSQCEEGVGVRNMEKTNSKTGGNYPKTTFSGGCHCEGGKMQSKQRVETLKNHTCNSN